MREWRWPRAGRIKFSHLQFDSTVYDGQGAQIALICFDELTHLTAHHTDFRKFLDTSVTSASDPGSRARHLLSGRIRSPGDGAE
jgi:hypothetical protein